MLIRISTLEEDHSPAEAERKLSYSSGFANAVAGMIGRAKELDFKSKWGWCTVRVQVTLDDGRVGEAFLGECSYESESDFVLNSGYFSGLVRDAIGDAR